jgi:hypothetical protein
VYYASATVQLQVVLRPLHSIICWCTGASARPSGLRNGAEGAFCTVFLSRFSANRTQLFRSVLLSDGIYVHQFQFEAQA